MKRKRSVKTQARMLRGHMIVKSMIFLLRKLMLLKTPPPAATKVIQLPIKQTLMARLWLIMLDLRAVHPN
jgi:hypothetical protein